MDFTDEQVMQVAAQTGTTPDFIRQQLIAEGNNVGGGAAAQQPINLGNMQATTLPTPPQPNASPVNLGTIQPAAPGWLPSTTHPRGDWAPTQLAPDEEAQFKRDMVTKPGYKDFHNAFTKEFGEAPSYDDPSGDYDYRGAWKGGVVPSIYKHDGRYHWESSLPDGQMLKAPDHPTAWMEHFMRATGKDPNEVGVQNEEQGAEYIASQQGGQPQRWSVNAGNLTMPPPPEPQAAGQMRRQGIRATGQGMAGQQALGGAGGGGGMSRVRKLFDQREKELGQEYSELAPHVAAGQQRLDALGGQAFGFHQERLNAEATRAQRAGEMYDQIEQQTAAAQQADQVARAKENNVLQAKGQELDQKRQDYTNARVRDMPTSSGVGSAFALAFAGIADALNSSVGNKSNFQQSTMQIVNGAIDRDVDEQLRQIQAKKGAADDTERSLLQLRQTTQDERAFRAATRAGYYEQFNARLAKLAAQTTSETARVAAAEGQTLFQQATEAAKQEARVAHLSDAQKRLRDVADKRLGVEATFAVKAAGAGAGKVPKVTPGVTGLVQINPQATGEDRTKAQGINSGAAGIIQNITALKQMAKKGATLSPDERQIARRRLGALKSQFNGVFGDGTAPNEAQLEALDGMFANPTELNIGDAEKQFEVFEQDAKAQTNAKMQSYGYALDDSDFEPE